MAFLNMSMHNSSNLALEILRLKSLPSSRESTSIVTDVCEDRRRFALSHWVRNLRIARWFLVGSTLYLRLKSAIQWLNNLLSKS